MEEEALVERGMVEVRRVLKAARERTVEVNLRDLLLLLDTLDGPEPNSATLQAAYRAIDRLRARLRETDHTPPAPAWEE